MVSLYTTPFQASIDGVVTPSRVGAADLNDRKYSQKVVTRNRMDPNTLLPCSSDNPLPQSSPLLGGQGDMSRKISLAQRRQSNAQLAQKAIGRKVIFILTHTSRLKNILQGSTTLIPLSSAQIHLVRSLWRQIYLTKGPTVIGTTVMQRLFFKCPALKDQFRDVPSSQLPNGASNRDVFAKNHSKQVTTGVQRLDDNGRPN